MEDNYVDPAIDSESSDSAPMLSGRLRWHEPLSFWRTLSGTWISRFHASSSSFQKRRLTGSRKDGTQLTRSDGTGEQMHPPSMQKDRVIRSKERKRNWKIWRSILYGQVKGSSDEDGEPEHPTSDALCALLLISVLLAVITTVLFFQLKTWPQVTRSYYTDDPYDSTRGGVPYTCGCSIPFNVQSEQSEQSVPSGQRPSEQFWTNPNVCYAPSDRETVTILMFKNYSTIMASIYDLIDENSPDNSARPITKLIEGALHITQEAHELTVQNVTVYDKLTDLYLGGNRQPDIFRHVPYPLSPEFNDFPMPYPGPSMQLNWVYHCHRDSRYDCDKCDLEYVMSLSREVLSPISESWISCYKYNWIENKQDICYEAKCVVYPPEALPASLAVQRFLEKFMALPGIRGFSSHLYRNDLNSTELRPSVLYLNMSVARSRPLPLGFLEVEKGSALWASLSSNFPSVEQECTALPLVEICINGTSICNAFTNANSYDLRCLDFKNSSQCLPFATNPPVLTPDDMNNTVNEDYTDTICPKSIECVKKPPYVVTWETATTRQNEALNSFLESKILKKEWVHRAGVCTKTYANVIRHKPPARAETAGTDNQQLSDTMFLESNCTNATVNQPAFCWATGRFHNLSDFPDIKAEYWAHLPEDLFQANGRRFACYRLEQGKFIEWFINAFGILFGWIGTIQLVFYATFLGVFVPARKRLWARWSKQTESGASTMHP